MSSPAAPTGVNTVPTGTDAANRSWRTLLQGLGIDVAVAVVLVLAASVSDIRFTREYWVAIGLLAGKSIIQAVVAYFMRILVKPTGATT